MREFLAEHACPHLWIFDESIMKRAKATAKGLKAKLPKHMRSLLQNSDTIVWLTQYENPREAATELGTDVCAYWDQVYDIAKAKPLLLINMLSARCLETIRIEYEKSLVTSANAVAVDYGEVRKIGSNIATRLDRKKLIHITDPNGTDLRFSIENRRVGVEVGTLGDCFSTGRECEVEIPAGEVYVAPLETSAYGTLVVDELKDFDVEGLKMEFEKGRIVSFQSEKGKASFRKLLDNAQGDKDRIAEFGIGINHGMKPIGLRIYDEKALGTAHIAIGNNTHLGGTNNASIHIDFILYNPTIKADDDPVMKEGQVAEQFQ